MKVTEYDTARDGGFVAEIEHDGRLWVAHHQAAGQWRVTSYQDEDAYLFLSADEVGKMIEIAASKEASQ